MPQELTRLSPFRRRILCRELFRDIAIIGQLGADLPKINGFRFLQLLIRDDGRNPSQFKEARLEIMRLSAVSSDCAVT